MASTGLQIVQDALALSNAVGTDQTLTADENATCLRLFNRLLDIFSTRNLAVYGQANQTFNTVSGTGTYTIGTGGAWATTRPERINAPAYSTISGVTFPCMPMTQGEYNLIAYKAQTQDWPDRYLYVNDNPLGIITLFPVPSAITPVTFSIDRVLTQLTTLATNVAFPPGYELVFQYKLGVMLMPFFGKKVRDYPDIVAQANEFFADVCRANKTMRVMQYDPAIGGSAGGGSALGRFLGGL